MKKIVICNIPMREKVANMVYTSDDRSLPVSDQPYRYPINSFLSQTVDKSDELKLILLVKDDGNSFYKKNTEDFKQEIEGICNSTGAKAEYVIINTAFAQDKEVHEQLMGRLVDEIDTDAHVIADITYGPKDLPIVIFSALNFAEKFLGCEVDNIVYGQAEFKDDKVVVSTICDMIPLYCLSSVTNTIKCDDSKKARQMLKSLLSF